ncbi:unnamed protein product [Ambrosiozyma monospora]|uniref:Unnamed protein product n=1 Tax=Ambrosiozyma monospora TaxID=43982 RepID=A0ACB5SYQ6_AMBMO|nr:unnamed protein product [Ambrosiozyma monospora]
MQLKDRFKLKQECGVTSKLGTKQWNKSPLVKAIQQKTGDDAIFILKRDVTVIDNSKHRLPETTMGNITSNLGLKDTFQKVRQLVPTQKEQYIQEKQMQQVVILDR